MKAASILSQTVMWLKMNERKDENYPINSIISSFFFFIYTNVVEMKFLGSVIFWQTRNIDWLYGENSYNS